MDLGRIFKQRPGVAAGRRLYARAVEQARGPAFYADWGAPDTMMGRFELYTLHTVLLVLKIKGQGPRSAEVAQALFDAYLEGLDIALREIGVGDLSMGKKMKKLGRAFYGRVQAWETAFAALPDEAPARDLVMRTVYEGQAHDGAARLGVYAVGAMRALETQPLEALLEGEINWPRAA